MDITLEIFVVASFGGFIIYILFDMWGDVDKRLGAIEKHLGVSKTKEE